MIHSSSVDLLDEFVSQAGAELRTLFITPAATAALAVKGVRIPPERGTVKFVCVGPEMLQVAEDRTKASLIVEEAGSLAFLRLVRAAPDHAAG